MISFAGAVAMMDSATSSVCARSKSVSNVTTWCVQSPQAMAGIVFTNFFSLERRVNLRPNGVSLVAFTSNARRQVPFPRRRKGSVRTAWMPALRSHWTRRQRIAPLSSRPVASSFTSHDGARCQRLRTRPGSATMFAEGSVSSMCFSRRPLMSTRRQSRWRERPIHALYGQVQFTTCRSGVATTDASSLASATETEISPGSPATVPGWNALARAPPSHRLVTAKVQLLVMRNL